MINHYSVFRISVTPKDIRCTHNFFGACQCRSMEWSGSGSEVASSNVNLRIVDSIGSSSLRGRTGSAPKITCQMSSSSCPNSSESQPKASLQISLNKNLLYQFYHVLYQFSQRVLKGSYDSFIFPSPSIVTRKGNTFCKTQLDFRPAS